LPEQTNPKKKQNGLHRKWGGEKKGWAPIFGLSTQKEKKGWNTTVEIGKKKQPTNKRGRLKIFRAVLTKGLGHGVA